MFDFAGLIGKLDSPHVLGISRRTRLLMCLVFIFMNFMNYIVVNYIIVCTERVLEQLQRHYVMDRESTSRAPSIRWAILRRSCAFL